MCKCPLPLLQQHFYPSKHQHEGENHLCRGAFQFGKKQRSHYPPATTPAVDHSVGCHSTAPCQRYTTALITVSGKITNNAVACAFFWCNLSTESNNVITKTPPPPPKKPLTKPQSAPTDNKITLLFPVICIICFPCVSLCPHFD